MKTVGIIAEYNPFHNGHKYHIEQAKKLTNSDYAVAVMSGNYVQRGEPAIFDKYTRTKAALLNGIDLVIELPVFSATASAELFASGAINILNKSSVIDYLCFGSEQGDIDCLNKIALYLAAPKPEYTQALGHYLSKGHSFPRARGEALVQMGFNSDILKAPNNILAIEYLKSLIKSNSAISPLTITRKGSGYHDTFISEETNGFSSASAIREAIRSGKSSQVGNSVPKNSIELFGSPHELDKMSELLHYKVKTSDADWLQQIADVDEGIENRISKIMSRTFNLSNIISEIKSKRYTFTKIQRTLLHIILEITNKECLDSSFEGTGYIRVLGFRRDAEALLSEISKKSLVPVVTNLKNAESVLEPKAFDFLMKEVSATDVYYLTNGVAVPKNYEFSKPLVIL